MPHSELSGVEDSSEESDTPLTVDEAIPAARQSTASWPLVQ